MVLVSVRLSVCLPAQSYSHNVNAGGVLMRIVAVLFSYPARAKSQSHSPGSSTTRPAYTFRPGVYMTVDTTDESGRIGKKRESFRPKIDDKSMTTLCTTKRSSVTGLSVSPITGRGSGVPMPQCNLTASYITQSFLVSFVPLGIS